MLTLMACTKDKIQPSGPLELWPLKIGNRWEYISYVPGGSGTGTMTVIRDTLIDSVKWFLNGRYVYPWIRNKSDGLYGYSNGSGLLLYKYPVSKNFIYWDGTDSVEVVSIDTLIHTTMGDFRCIRYKRPALQTYSFRDEYFTPGVGLIQSVHYSFNTPSGQFGMTYKMVLSNYILK